MAWNYDEKELEVIWQGNELPMGTKFYFIAHLKIGTMNEEDEFVP